MSNTAFPCSCDRISDCVYSFSIECSNPNRFERIFVVFSVVVVVATNVLRLFFNYFEIEYRLKPNISFGLARTNLKILVKQNTFEYKLSQTSELKAFRLYLIFFFHFVTDKFVTCMEFSSITIVWNRQHSKQVHSISNRIDDYRHKQNIY